MSIEILLMLLIVAAALVLFSLERLPADVIALGLVIVLVVSGLLPVERAFEGFGSDAVVMIFGLLVMTSALERTGVVERIGEEIRRLAGQDSGRLLIIVMIAGAVLSAFISNTATAALFVPIVLTLARRLKASASELLMPLAFAAILSSSVTLVSTSTNIVVSGLMTRYDLAPLGMFEMAPVGIPILIVGLFYMYFIGERLIPDRSSPAELGEEFNIRPYIAEVMVLPESDLVGKSLVESKLGSEMDLMIVRIIRNDRFIAPLPNIQMKAEDELLVRGDRDQILKIKDVAGIEIKADVKLSDPRLQDEDVQLAEAILMPGSSLTGRTLKEMRFRQRYDLIVLGINRRGRTLYDKLSQEPLRVGDQLLLQGRREDIRRLDESNALRVIGTIQHDRPKQHLAPAAAVIFGGSLLLAAINALPLALAVLLGVLLIFLTGCISPEEAYQDVKWRALIVIGSMLALGAAMEHTGTARFLAQQIVGAGASPYVLLTGFFALSLILTQPMSNQAAAVVVVPIAIQTATSLGLNPRTFAVMIAVGASSSFITPLEPACLIVYGPGNYRFMDFLKVGSLLTIAIYLIAIALVPMIWPF